MKINVTVTLESVVRRWNDRRCRRGKHRWLNRSQASKERMYYVRTCEHCGLEQIQSAGPMGDRAWHSIKDYNWKWDWEKSDFYATSPNGPLAANVQDERRAEGEFAPSEGSTL